MKNIGNQIKSIALKKLVTHPDNPNRMSKANFSKLVRNIEQTGRYEPLLVRPHPDKAGCFQIINGCHRYQALKELRYKTANVVVWNIDDHQTDILLASINRLSGTDVLDKKLELLRKLNSKLSARELAKLLPATSKQIERLTNLKLPATPANIPTNGFAQPMVFFVTSAQKQKIEKALALATENIAQNQTRAKTRSVALVLIAERFLAASAADEIKQYFGTALRNAVPRHLPPDTKRKQR
jgi:ParB/RepB/Spo0J family partition protein